MLNLKELLNKIDNKTLVTVFPHPDDETVPTGGLLLEAKKLGWKTIVICLTKGGAGKVSFKTNLKTTEIREGEFQNAVKALEISEYYLLDFEDSKLRDSIDEINNKLVELLTKINPGVIVTYDHSGATGHPDHIAISLLITDILRKTKLNTKLIWVSFRGLSRIFNIRSKSYKYFTNPHYRLRISLGSRLKKTKAFLSHRSQIHSLMFRITFIFYCLTICEYYHLADLDREYSYEYVEFDI